MSYRTAPEGNSQRRGLLLRWLPELGIAVFLVLYFCAAALYPGGHRFDAAAPGYSHVSNYWCDLLDATSYSGEPNRGRPLALAGTVLLPLSLLPLWLNVTLLFRPTRFARGLVIGGGSGAMLGATLVSFPQHDLVINIASVLGFGAVLLIARDLWRSRRWALFATTLLPILLGGANYIMWQNAWGLAWIPMVQKAAYAALFVWVHVTMRAIRRASSLASRSS